MNRRLLAVAGVLVAVVVALGIVGSLAGREDPGGVPGDLRAADACEPVTDHPAGGGSVHRAGTIDYDRVPPNSGEHNPNWLRVLRRVYEPDDNAMVEQAVHNLEHGYVVVWYDPERGDRDRLGEVLGGLAERKVFAMPWPRDRLPAPYVLTAWGHEQRCSGVSGEAIRAFFAEHGAENGDAPEAGGP